MALLQQPVQPIVDSFGADSAVLADVALALAGAKPVV